MRMVSARLAAPVEERLVGHRAGEPTAEPEGAPGTAPGTESGGHTAR